MFVQSVHESKTQVLTALFRTWRFGLCPSKDVHMVIIFDVVSNFILLFEVVFVR